MPDVAAFDFDGTLTTGGSVFDFLSAVGGRHAVLTATLALAPRLAHAAIVGGAAADETKERLFEHVLAGVESDRFEEVAVDFAERHLATRIRNDVRLRLEWHRGRGDTVVVVSASPEAYVRVAADRLAADATIATRLALNDEGRLTGRYEGANCRGEEKLRRLRLWIGDSGVELDRLWAYGNSRGDLRMLQAADVGVNVGRLGRVSRLRSFPGLRETRPVEQGG